MKKKCKVCKKLKEYYAKGMCQICYRRQYDKQPKMEEYRKQYNKRPEVKQRVKEYSKEYQKEYYQRPEVKLKKNKYAKEYRQRPEIKQKILLSRNISSLKRELNSLLERYPIEIRTKRIDLRIYGIQDALVYFNSIKS